jgi:hypothetical protein
MTAYKQYASTVYSRHNLSIITTPSPSSGEPPVKIPLNATDYRLLWQRLLVPDPAHSNRLDRSLIDSVTFNLAWLLRLYDDEFPDDAHTPAAHLQNFMAVPLQFMVTVLQFANTTLQEDGLGLWQFPLPGDMRTTAVGGRLMQRLAGEAWVVWLFTLTAGAVVLGVGGLFGWMVWGQEYRPAGITGVGEMDFVEKCRSKSLSGDSGSRGRRGRGEEMVGVVAVSSPWERAAMLRGSVAKLRVDGEGREVLLVTKSVETTRTCRPVWTRRKASGNRGR